MWVASLTYNFEQFILILVPDSLLWGTIFEWFVKAVFVKFICPITIFSRLCNIWNFLFLNLKPLKHCSLKSFIDIDNLFFQNKTVNLIQCLLISSLFQFSYLRLIITSQKLIKLILFAIKLFFFTWWINQLIRHIYFLCFMY